MDNVKLSEKQDGWLKISEHMPPANTVVMTKIDDEHGPRNIQELKCNQLRTLWWFPDCSMYVYYTPTHWKPIK